MKPTKRQLQDLQDRLKTAYPDAKCALDFGTPFQLLVATVLSAQTTDARVNATTPALFAQYPDARTMAEAPVDRVEGIIASIGFHRTKARNLVALSQQLVARHGGEVPNDQEALERLPGVGQKTANVVRSNAFGVPSLAVDTHVFRVARRLGLSKGKSPEKVEDDLTGLLPRERWIDAHHELIFHGRRVCHAQKPDCPHCPVLDLCPTGMGRIDDPHSGKRFTPPKDAAARAEAAVEASVAPGEGPMRIVSLVPSVTELLTQWGLAGRLVGRTRYCISPKWIRNTVFPVGGTKDPDLKLIADLKPDLVILEKDENPKEVAEALTKLGIPWMALEVGTVAACAGAWRALGDRLGVREAAETRALALEKRLKKKPKKGPRALTLIWKDPWVSVGEGTYVADLVKRAGFTLLGPERYPRLTEAELDALDPELVILPTEPYRFNARSKAELQKRFPEARVEVVDGQAMTWYLSRTEEGLDLVEGLRS